MTKPAFELKTAASAEEVRRAYAFAVSILGNVDHASHTLDRYLEAHRTSPGLLVYAEAGGRIVGTIFGRIDGGHVLIGMVAVSPDYRRQGIASAAMRRLEIESQKLGQNTLLLGARPEAEPFYLRCGFRPNLFIQVAQGGLLASLKKVNAQYRVAWEYEGDGGSRLMLATPRIDKTLQEEYERLFPGASTQYVFIKTLPSH